MMGYQKTKWIKIAIICIVILLIYLFGIPKLSLYLQSRYLSTAPNGTETPGTYGILYERIKITNSDRLLDAYIVMAPSKEQKPAVVLIFHGSEETISCWAKAQKILYDQGVSSLVFDYSGFGNSSRPGSIKNLNRDAIAVYLYTVSRFKNSRIFVVGFSLGNAPMLASIKAFKPVPSGVIVGSAFSSLKELGKYSGKANTLFKLLANVIPDVWNNTTAIKDNTAPLLVIHSDSDASNPIFMGQKIYAAANTPKQLVVLHGLEHNAPISDSSQIWWAPVIQFIKGNNNIKSSH
jgi:alpha-beta hydrolase superfamily lysophospholipase